MSRAVADAFRRYVTEEAGDIPMPGSGRTWDRFEALTSCAATDLSLARLVEGHVDALAVLAEGGVPDRDGGARDRRASVREAPPSTGRWSPPRPPTATGCSMSRSPSRSSRATKTRG